ncbi:MAG: RICIN domain-containing protein, partial [Bacteroidaceae bacterium]
MKRICVITVMFAFVANIVSAGILKFNPYVKYRIESIYSTGSSVTLGANHDINSPLCLERYSFLAKAEDCYWKFDYKGDGKYSICNASTNEYITLDDNYASTPMILRYIHLSTEIEGDASLWYIKKTDSDTYGEVIYFQNAYNNSFFFNLRSSSYVMGAYEKTPESVPNGRNELFRIYDENDELYIAEEISEDTTVVVEHDSLALLPIDCPIVHVYRADGKLDAFPQNFIVSSSISSDSVVIKAINGQTFAYASYEVDSISDKAPTMPHFNSFKFNNKYNHHIVEDAQGVFYGDTLITAYVVGIGKNLRPSFKLDDDVQAWIADKPQQSKVSSVRFTRDITYTIARRGYNILRQTVDSVYQIRPYGSETTVRVDFATDHSVGQYTDPTIYITTDDGTMITSKSYYWKAKITIDGAGVFPDMPETAMEIKGRGNTSWTSTGKAPY